MEKVLAVIISYLLGGILSGEVVALLSRVDLRKKGSGNPGATNAYRILGPISGILVLGGDVLKGILGAMIGLWLGGSQIAPWCGLAVIIGHNWPLQFKFKGGKGIAASLGTIIVLVPKTLLVLAPIWFLFLFIFGFVSLSSLAAAFALPFSCFLFYPQERSLLLYGVIVFILAVYRHRANIQRIISGTENKVFAKKIKEEEK
jgi:glycerol-3-phosphate acyltransferase PlsY